MTASPDAATFELVRTALVVRLAQQLGDPALVRRAARQAASAAEQLAGMHPPASGYRREDLHDAWTRYLPSPPEASATSATDATAEPDACECDRRLMSREHYLTCDRRSA